MTNIEIAHVSEGKKRIVANLTDLIKNKKTILIASIKDIPGSQFQKISKKLRGKAIVKVPKKNLIFRALDNSSNEVAQKLKESIIGSVAILFSDIDAFDLAAELIQNKSPVKAKPGQEASEDIVVQAGPTDLMPGPAISELGALGIQIQIDKGKITIKESKTITKEGEKISENAADLMNKLDMKPFSVGFTPLAAFDTQANKLYTSINIDKEETLLELKTAFGKALPFAVEIGYTTKNTIGFLLQKAGRSAKALEKFGAEEKKEEPVEEEKEIVNQDSQDNSNESEQANNNSENPEPSGEASVSEPEPSEDNVQPEKENQEENK
jgi:large subunit ribosomal protein L10